MPRDDSGHAAPLLRPGRNCWRIERAKRVSFLVDAAAYFRAVREAMRAARHSIFILSWDIDSRTLLVPEGAHDGYPEPLGDFLNAVVASRPGLRACVLSWDYALLYALEREWLPVVKLDWRTHPRLTFRLDDRHPVGASHHQKVVVIDDTVAFVGGLDLTQHRWDTPAHRADEPHRRDPDGKRYGPFHDVQAVVDGGVARALGELVRERWRRAGLDDAPSLLRRATHDPWPASAAVDIADVDVAIARTEPPYGQASGVSELRQLHVDALGAARRTIFLENQYFTSTLIADALAARLAEPQGPEVVLVSHRTECGWIEESTMGVLRARLHRRLLAADPHRRFKAYCPELPGLGPGTCLNVHSKIMVVDDDLLTIGSCNLSNRSLGFDTECNIAIEARGHPALRAAIARVRDRLLGEHLDADPDDIAATLARRGSLIGTIDALATGERRLTAFEPSVSPDVDELVPDGAVIDPDGPLDSDGLVRDVVPPHVQRPLRGRLLALGAVICAIAVLAAAWRWTPLREWLDLNALINYADTLDDLPLSPLFVVGGYVLAGLLVVPLMLLIAATGVVFGPVLGAVYALCGALLSALVTYAIGRKLGRTTVRRLAGPRLNTVSRKLARRGLLAVVLVRLVPVAPYTVVNLVAGASNIRLGDFLLGTLIGLLPGVLGTVVFVDRIVATLRQPGFVTFATLAVIAGLLGGFAVMMHRRLAKRERAATPAGD